MVRQSPLIVCRRGPGLSMLPWSASQDRPRIRPAGVTHPSTAPIGARFTREHAHAASEDLRPVPTLVRRRRRARCSGVWRPAWRAISRASTGHLQPVPRHGRFRRRHQRREGPPDRREVGTKVYRHHTGFPGGLTTPSRLERPGETPRARDRGGRARHAAEDEARAEAVQEAQGLRGRHASPRGAAPRPLTV